MKFYEMTRLKLTTAGWVVNPFPLVWTKSDNKGILPDFNRGPRQVYETAFLCTKGDRKIVQAVSNSTGGRVGYKIHMSQKATDAQQYFLSMLIDETTTIFDPTAGSGSSLKAAKTLGAARGLGLESVEDYVNEANSFINKIVTENR